MALLTYDPNKVTVVVGGKLITGFAADTFVTAERDEDMFTKIIGVDGIGTRAKSNNYGGTVTIMLMATSPANGLFQALATADEQTNSGVVPLVIRDLSGSALAIATSVWVKKLPSVEFGRSVSERSWVLDTDSLQLAVTGNTVAA